jgi:hypothetical protein
MAPGAAALASGVLSAACDDVQSQSGGIGADASDTTGDSLGDVQVDGARDGAGSDIPPDTTDGLGDVSADTGGDIGPDGEPVACEATASDVEGPFHIDGAPERTVLADVDEPGVRLWIDGVVTGPDCASPVAGALLDIWQADDEATITTRPATIVSVASCSLIVTGASPSRRFSPAGIHWAAARGRATSISW